MSMTSHSSRWRRALGAIGAALSLCGAPLVAQQGDRAGEEQAPLPPDLHLPPPEPLSPEQALKAFVLADGFSLDLFAAEPLVVAPVSITFDDRGRLWVVEMPAYMRDIDGTDEQAPTGAVVVITDEDGDGAGDRRTDFLTDLVLPRSVLPLADGSALVIAPPSLLHVSDTDGDGRADEVRVVAEGFGGIESPEHAGNGMIWCVDNWIRLSQHALEYRWLQGAIVEARPSPGYGQWGLAQDDAGRLFVTPNSHPLLVSRHPPSVVRRHPLLRTLGGMAEEATSDLRVWPAHQTPGINRGYQQGMLREGKLAVFTGACGTLIFRGDALGAEAYGNAFVCEPCGNLVRRFKLEEDASTGAVKAHAEPEGAEFVASTDERFRPVNLAEGPDGALYIADFARGVIQHRLFVTSFLRSQVIERRLEAPLDRGRIWRVRRTGHSGAPIVHPAAMRVDQLPAALRHERGWVRDRARERIVQEGLIALAPELGAIIADDSASFAVRIAAIGAVRGLEGHGATGQGGARAEIVAAAQQQGPLALRVQALRALESRLGEPRVRRVFADALDDPMEWVRVQAALSLGEARDSAALSLILRTLRDRADEVELRQALLTALSPGSEVSVLSWLERSRAWLSPTGGRLAVARALAEAVLGRSDARDNGALLEIALRTERPWLSGAIFDRCRAYARLDTPRPRMIPLDRRVPGLADASADESHPAHAAIVRLAVVLGAAGGAGASPGGVVAELRPLDTEQQSRFERGRALFAVHCATCHGEDGAGRAGLGPPLAGTARALGPPEDLVRIVTSGLRGPIEVLGARYDGTMPPAPFNAETAIASVLTYVRRAFGNNADPIDPRFVGDVRRRTPARAGAWTREELDAVRGR